MISLLLLVFIFIILLRYYIYHYGRSGRLLHLMPGPIGLPFIGNALSVYNFSLEELWCIQRMACNVHYPVLKVWFFMIAGVSIRHPDDIETILSSPKYIEKGFFYKFIHSWIGTGLLTSKGTKWHNRRKILTSAFHFHILKQFIDILIEESNYMTKSLKNLDGSVIENLVSFISDHTLNAICATVMGTSLQDMGTLGQQYRQAIHDMDNNMVYRTMNPWFYYDIIFALSSMGKKQVKNLKILHGFTEKIIANRKYYHKVTDGKYLHLEDETIAETDMEILGESVRRKRLAILDILIAASRNNDLSDSDIREEIDTFMFKGHDTVTMGLCFVLLLLAEHKDIQDHVRNEVNAVMEENSGKLTVTALNKLQYLERCLKESLRLYPNVDFIARKCNEDVRLKSYVVPSGITIHINVYDLHRDPNFWPNPDVFDPDRFLPDKIQTRHPYSYIPFSAGPRNCIGQRFALMEMKAMAASLLHNFYLEPIDYLKDLTFKMDMVLRVTQPIRMRFVPIERMQLCERNIN